ncbi:alpha/beta-hydrolase, partial [Thozetella sp. PMI_491]
VVTTDHTVLTRDGAAIPLRSYRPAAVDPAKPLPAYIYFHGGGMMFGSIETEDYAGAFISSRSGFQVLHVEYRHTPEFTHPTALNDAWDTFEWVNANATALAVDPANLLVGGVSAGGCLTASVVFQEVALARKEDRPVRIKGQLLVIPWLVHRDVYPYELFASKDKCSIVQCAETSILPSAVYNRFTDIFDVKDPAEPLMNVGLASLEDLEGMPRAAFIVSGWDMLRDEAFILAEKLEKLGVPTKKHIFTGLPHAFRKWAALESSKRYDDLTIESLKW